MTNTPMSIFAQNNGIISITKCANRTAGYCCAGFLFTFGKLAKISGVFLAIPDPVLGGVTTCKLSAVHVTFTGKQYLLIDLAVLFASVVVSGLKVISFTKFSRRNRFVLAASLSLGIGRHTQISLGQRVEIETMRQAIYLLRTGLSTSSRTPAQMRLCKDSSIRSSSS